MSSTITAVDMSITVPNKSPAEDSPESFPLLSIGSRPSTPDTYEDALESSSLPSIGAGSSNHDIYKNASESLLLLLSISARPSPPEMCRDAMKLPFHLMESWILVARGRSQNTGLEIEALIKHPPLADELYTSDELYLERLSQLCLPRWEYRERRRKSSQAIRSETPEYSVIMQKPPSEVWNRALRQIRRGFFDGGPIESILSHYEYPEYTTLFYKPVLSTVSIILYDIEAQKWPGSLQNNGKERHSSREGARERFAALPRRIDSIIKFQKHFRQLAEVVFKHMLLIDYGMDTTPIHIQSDPPDDDKNQWPQLWCIWNELCAVVSGFAECCAEAKPQDALVRSIEDCIHFLPRLKGYTPGGRDGDCEMALMLHYYHTRRTPLETADYMAGSTGYQGVLQEMIDEVPTIGTERLARKLSVDRNEIIPSLLRGRENSSKRWGMINKVEEIASVFGISLFQPRVQGMGRPLLELYYQDGFVRSSRQKKFG